MKWKGFYAKESATVAKHFKQLERYCMTWLYYKANILIICYLFVLQEISC